MADAWRVDTDRIAVIGGSAGAISGLVAAYVDSREGHSGNPGFSSEFHALVAISGSLRRINATCPPPGTSSSRICLAELDQTDLIDGRQSRRLPALLSVVGVKDDVLPAEDSLAVHKRAQETGLMSSLIWMEGAGHVPYREIVSSHGPRLMAFLRAALRLEGAECPWEASRSKFAAASIA